MLSSMKRYLYLALAATYCEIIYFLDFLGSKVYMITHNVTKHKVCPIALINTGSVDLSILPSSARCGSSWTLLRCDRTRDMKDGKEELGTEPSTCAVPHHWSDKSVEPKGKAFIYQSINVLKKHQKPWGLFFGRITLRINEVPLFSPRDRVGGNFKPWIQDNWPSLSPVLLEVSSFPLLPNAW